MEKVACGAGELTWPSLLEALDKDRGEGSAVLQINCYLLSFLKWGAHTPQHSNEGTPSVMLNGCLASVVSPGMNVSQPLPCGG